MLVVVNAHSVNKTRRSGLFSSKGERQITIRITMQRYFSIIILSLCVFFISITWADVVENVSIGDLSYRVNYKAKYKIKQFDAIFSKDTLLPEWRFIQFFNGDKLYYPACMLPDLNYELSPNTSHGLSNVRKRRITEDKLNKARFFCTEKDVSLIYCRKLLFNPQIESDDFEKLVRLNFGDPDFVSIKNDVIRYIYTSDKGVDVIFISPKGKERQSRLLLFRGSEVYNHLSFIINIIDKFTPNFGY